MAIIYNGRSISSIKYNGVTVSEVYYCNTQDGSCTKVFPNNCVCVNYAAQVLLATGTVSSPFLQCDIENLEVGTSCTVGDWTVTRCHSTTSDVCYSLTLNVDCTINLNLANYVCTRVLGSSVDTVDITAQAMAQDGYECVCQCVCVRAYTYAAVGCGEYYCACVCRGVSNVVSGTAVSTSSKLGGHEQYCIPASFTIKAATYCGDFLHTQAYIKCPLQFEAFIRCPNCNLCTITTTTFGGNTKTFCRILGAQIYEY